MEYYILLTFALLGAIIIYGVYVTVTTIAEKFFEKQRLGLRSRNIDITLPLRLQAYERITLFLERINPTNLLIRVAPISSDKVDYQNFLVAHIDQEFEHNLTQQIYISDECWTIVMTAKNATIQMIRKASLNPEVSNADKLREAIFNDLLDKQSPSNNALAYIKKEVAELW